MAPACEPIKSSIELATWCSRQLLVLLHRLLWSLLVSGAGSPFVPSLFFLLLSALFLSMWVCIVLLGRFPPACEVHQGYSQTVKKWPPFPITFLWLPWKLHNFKGAWIQGKCSEVCLFVFCLFLGGSNCTSGFVSSHLFPLYRTPAIHQLITPPLATYKDWCTLCHLSSSTIPFWFMLCL